MKKRGINLVSGGMRVIEAHSQILGRSRVQFGFGRDRLRSRNVRCPVLAPGSKTGRPIEKLGQW